MQKISIPATTDSIPDGIDFIRQTFKKYKIKRKSMMEALLIAEESMVRLIGNAEENVQMQISIRRSYNNAIVTISAKGSHFESRELGVEFGDSDIGHDSEEAIRSLLLHAHADKISYYRRGGYNFVRINTGVKEQIFFFKTLLALFFGFVVAAILSLVLSDDTAKAMSEQVLLPIQTIFVNSLQLVTAPCMFFSIMVSVSRYMSLTDPDRVSQKVIIGYLFTSVFAVGVGVLVCTVFQPNLSLGGFASELAKYESNNVSDINTILEMFADIFPTNIITPFLENNPVQLLVLSVIGGVALGKAGRNSSTLVDIFDALDKFFGYTAEIVSGLIPFAVFFVTILKVLYFGGASVIVTVKVVALVILGFVFVFCGYILFLLVVARLNPIVFLKKSAKTIVGIFLRGSSVASIPDTTACCQDKLGASPKVCNFSIPFGAISNLDGNCVYLTIAGMLLARICGVDILGRDLVTVALMVIILSIGSPITPGSAIIALTMLFSQIGMSLSIISLLIGVNAFIEMILAVCNTVGDMVTSLVIAKQEKLLDESVYYAK